MQMSKFKTFSTNGGEKMTRNLVILTSVVTAKRGLRFRDLTSV